ncbi:MAG: hypothetical protein WC615_03030 [Mucilaginibacter sp.]|jgi:hypothetical protein|uniref:hypothetical protein n=1 Tax=Mucilaginibacter sp. TaxID=1882438 RepID=UPI00356AE27E
METIDLEIETIELDTNIPERYNYYRSYYVKKADTNIITVSANDFKPLKHRPSITASAVYTLRPGSEDYYSTTNLIKAMEKAKAGALLYIKGLIDMGLGGTTALLQYRIDHYEDLHINLIDANIQLVEQRMINDHSFKWIPYRIKN